MDREPGDELWRRIRSSEDSLREHNRRLAELERQFRLGRRELEKLAREVERVTRADEIADAVAKKIKETRDTALTEDSVTISRRQAWIAGAALLVTVASPWLERLA